MLFYEETYSKGWRGGAEGLSKLGSGNKNRTGGNENKK
jgi:hypothetical protein